MRKPAGDIVPQSRTRRRHPGIGGLLFLIVAARYRTLPAHPVPQCDPRQDEADSPPAVADVGEWRGHGRLRSSASASFARVKFVMFSVSEPYRRRSRYMPGQRSSGTMRGSRTGFFGEPRPVFSPSQGLEMTAENSALVTVDSSSVHRRDLEAFSGDGC